MITDMLADGQTPFVTVQTKPVVPVGSPVTSVVAEKGDTMLTVPPVVHPPDPVVGTTAASVPAGAQTVMLEAAEGPGGRSRNALTLLLLGGQTPLTIVHTKVLRPADRFATVAPGEAGDAIVPDPPRTVQLPVPEAGVLPDRITDELQTVCGVPAIATDGSWSACTVTVLPAKVQVPDANTTRR